MESAHRATAIFGEAESGQAKALGEAAPFFGLSVCEREVMGMLASAYVSSYVRDALGISDGTAKVHVAHIYQKLDVHSRNDLLELVEERLEQA